MASPFSGAKKTVDLNGPRRTGSRIRRDPPPPPPKKVTAGEMRAREARTIVAGIAIFGLALTALVFQGSRAAEASLGDYTVLIAD